MTAKSFSSRIVAWQRTHGRHDLPWQNTRDAYRIWLSEIMLQQTQVTTVLPYYSRFLEKFPTVTALAAAPEDDVLALWAGLGYYSRARNLRKAAKHVVALHGGRFPADVALLAELPGVGRSTAAAIAAFAYDVIAPILDGNVKRVLARHAGVEGFPGAGPVEKKLWLEAEARVPKRASDMVAYTQGLMDMGATICSRSDPTCLLCPVAADCAARITERTNDIPAPRPSKTIPHRTQRYLLAVHGSDVLLIKRPSPGIWGGLWCLPEIGEHDDASDIARLQFGVDRSGATHDLPPFDHTFTHFRLTLSVTRVTVTRLATRCSQPGTLWLQRTDFPNAALPAPMAKLLATF